VRGLERCGLGSSRTRGVGGRHRHGDEGRVRHIRWGRWEPPIWSGSIVRLCIADYLTAALGKQFSAPDILRDKVEKRQVGKKTGEGFYAGPDARRADR